MDEQCTITIKGFDKRIVTSTDHGHEHVSDMLRRFTWLMVAFGYHQDSVAEAICDLAQEVTDDKIYNTE